MIDVHRWDTGDLVDIICNDPLTSCSTVAFRPTTTFANRCESSDASRLEEKETGWKR